MSGNGDAALVTGAGRGIGRAIALRLGAAGMTVFGTATTPAGAEAIRAALEARSIRGRGLVADVGDDGSAAELIAAVEAEHGAPFVLVNNAGVTRDNLLLRMRPEEWETVLNVNLGSMYRLCRACLRGMARARRGRIVNISSVVGASGNPGQTNYAASKAGIEGFTRSLAREIGSRGVTVNAVAPGFIDTDMTRALSGPQREALLAQIPLGRLGRPEEVAEVVAFLASEAGGYITGETVHVNGGMYMR